MILTSLFSTLQIGTKLAIFWVCFLETKKKNPSGSCNSRAPVVICTIVTLQNENKTSHIDYYDLPRLPQPESVTRLIFCPKKFLN